jgi:hypothetical protein
VNGGHDSGAWRSVADTLNGAIFEECLASPHRVALADEDLGVKSWKIVADDRDALYLRATVDPLLGAAGNRYIQALCDGVKGRAARRSICSLHESGHSKALASAE